MSETPPNSKRPAPIQLTPETPQPALIPADQVKPEDIGTLSIEYRDGQPVIVVSGGTVIPAGLKVVGSSGTAVASYTAGAKALFTDFYGEDGALTGDFWIYEVATDLLDEASASLE
ncbi:hypothetical protein ACFQL8_36070 [Streptomyces goshikiensis]|uniref:hypothetical protein n=1 Tax=Streptomyces goshikiensis TaxID=1942 RepID=UPI001675C7E5|nr:hypothetical protein [Streptomyces goshikiensis]GHD80108.1 hypothetical protein GCM10010336_63300 [Streptomyces goshikiensis]